MNKIFLTIHLIFMTFFCSFTSATLRELEDNRSLWRIRAISGSFEEGFLEICARMAQQGGSYPAYVSNIPEIQAHLETLQNICQENSALNKAILTSLPKEFQKPTISFPSLLLDRVKTLSGKTKEELLREFLSVLAS